MDLTGIIQQLRQELDKIEVSIRAMERIAATSGVRRRGRPPKWMKSATADDMVGPRRRGRPSRNEKKASGEDGKT